MSEVSIQILISMLVGGPIGLLVYNFIYRKDRLHVGFESLVGVVAGSFLGSFALLLVSLIVSELGSFPKNYYSTTGGAIVFTVGLLKFIKESIQGE